MIDSRKPYRAKNLIFKKSAINNDADNVTGFLEISVANSKNNEPIEHALVRVSKVTVTGLYKEKAEGRLIVQYQTDINGNTPTIELPALNELNPNINDYYIISVHANGYYTAYVFNVEIFPDTTSIYNITLSNISSGEEKFNFIIQPTRSKLIK